MNVKLNEIPTTMGIYKFTNIENNKIYIGSARNLRKRFVQHISALKLNKHHSSHFQNAWNKYGEDKFIYEIIEHVDLAEQLLIREQYYLDTLLFAQDYIGHKSNKFLELGYNINPISLNRLGSIQPKESIIKSIKNNPKVLEIIHYNFYGNKIGEYISAGEASKITGINKTSILLCCKHESEYTKKGFFIFKNEESKYSDYFKSLNDTGFVIQPWNKGLKGIKLKKDKCLILFDRYGRYINKFSFQTDISKYLNCTTSNISSSKNKSIIKNHLIFDISFDYEPIIQKLREEYWYIHEVFEVEHKHIMVFDNFDNFIISFDTVGEASEFLNIKSNSIYYVLCGKRNQIKGFKFKYFDDMI